MIKTIFKDARFILEKDPAAASLLEVFLCYPGFHAVVMHRIAHCMYRRRFHLLARLLALCNRFLTGVDIHPAAKVGSPIFIDHGMGVVIGETTEIGASVIIYQDVTLGGTGKETGKRHPTIGDHVILCAGAKVLGSIKVGHGSRIGAGAVVLKEVPPCCTVVGVPGTIVKVGGQSIRVDQEKIRKENKPEPNYGTQLEAK